MAQSKGFQAKMQKLADVNKLGTAVPEPSVSANGVLTFVKHALL